MKQSIFSYQASVTDTKMFITANRRLQWRQGAQPGRCFPFRHVPGCTPPPPIPSPQGLLTAGWSRRASGATLTASVKSAERFFPQPGCSSRRPEWRRQAWWEEPLEVLSSLNRRRLQVWFSHLISLRRETVKPVEDLLTRYLRPAAIMEIPPWTSVWIYFQGNGAWCVRVLLFFLLKLRQSH